MAYCTKLDELMVTIDEKLLMNIIDVKKLHWLKLAETCFCQRSLNRLKPYRSRQKRANPGHYPRSTVDTHTVNESN